ncbi:MAG: hypothetical protein ABIL09_12610 [Gemmatimonadota bacterium]
MSRENRWSERDYRNILRATRRLGWSLGSPISSLWSETYTRDIFDASGLYVGVITFTPRGDVTGHDVRWFGAMCGVKLLALLGDL